MISYSGISDSEPDGGTTFCSNVHKTHGPWVAANMRPSWIIAARGIHRSGKVSAICCFVCDIGMPSLLLIVFTSSPCNSFEMRVFSSGAPEPSTEQVQTKGS